MAFEEVYNDFKHHVQWMLMLMALKTQASKKYEPFGWFKEWITDMYKEV